jgi:NAD-dependent SIR2 family protein deacetylase
MQQSDLADLHLVLGSSLTVRPACKLPKRTAKKGGRLVIVNLQRTPLDHKAALRVFGRTDAFMQLVMAKLGTAAVTPWTLANDRAAPDLRMRCTQECRCPHSLW